MPFYIILDVIFGKELFPCLVDIKSSYQEKNGTLILPKVLLNN